MKLGLEQIIWLIKQIDFEPAEADFTVTFDVHFVEKLFTTMYNSKILESDILHCLSFDIHVAVHLV